MLLLIPLITQVPPLLVLSLATLPTGRGTTHRRHYRGRVFESFAMLAMGIDPTGAIGLSLGTVTITVVAVLLNVPISVAQLVGLLVTYAEQRGQEAPVSAGQLAAELG